MNFYTSSLTRRLRRVFLLLCLLLCVALGGCSQAPLLFQSRQDLAAGIAGPAGLSSLEIQAELFRIQGYGRGLDSSAESANSPVLHVYLEGDGKAWRSRTVPSEDPTPIDPTGLKLAAQDRHTSVLYLARPCQYLQSRACHPAYWTGARFSDDVITSLNESINQVADRGGFNRVALHGYSGGGTLALLLAARRSDVVAVTTYAGVLDTQAWVEHHNVAPLADSQNPMDFAARLQNIPQIHYCGAGDDVMPCSLTRAAARHLGRQVQVLEMSGGHGDFSR